MPAEVVPSPQLMAALKSLIKASGLPSVKEATFPEKALPCAA